MSDSAQSAPNLASLRRRGSRRRTYTDTSPLLQPDLFADLPEAPTAGTPETVISATAAASTALEAAGLPRDPVPGVRSAPAEVMSGSPSGLTGLPSSARVEERSRLAEVSTGAELPQPSVPEPTAHSWTVSGLVRHVRGLVERGYGQVTVEGEISNWRPAGSGHCYFTIKDAEAQLSAVIFRRQASLLRFRPNDGDAVRLRGQLSVYESRGQMQLIAEWIEQMGFGALLAALQRLKEQLRAEGLFDRKRPLPAFPRCIGVVTSLQGAALRDIVKVCRRRHAAVQLLIYPAAVQGPNCAAEVAAGLRWFSAHPDRAEVVLVARGGGSWEDLHGFDDEAVVRAIAGSTLPVITGLGHATDSTLADLAADQCAPTPSAAAELLTAGQHRVEEHVERLGSRLRRVGSFELLRAQQRLARLGAGIVLRRVEDALNRRAQRVDELSFRAEAARRGRRRSQEMRLGAIETRLSRQDPLSRLRDNHLRLDRLRNRLQGAAAGNVNLSQRRAEAAQTRLLALSPLGVLERGYALVYGPDGHLLRSATAVDPGQEITARLAAGSLRAQVVSAG